VKQKAAVSIESVSLRKLVGVTRAPFGAGPDWKRSVHSTKGRPWVCVFHFEVNSIASQ